MRSPHFCGYTPHHGHRHLDQPSAPAHKRAAVLDPEKYLDVVGTQRVSGLEGHLSAKCARLQHTVRVWPIMSPYLTSKAPRSSSLRSASSRGTRTGTP
jgi:hypothetical protein